MRYLPAVFVLLVSLGLLGCVLLWYGVFLPGLEPDAMSAPAGTGVILIILSCTGLSIGGALWTNCVLDDHKRERETENSLFPEIEDEP